MSAIVISTERKKGNYFILVLALLLFVYVFLRALLMSITRDESYTFLEFVLPGYWLPHVYTDISANDHLLNTWLAILTNSLFGSSELSLRIPNVLAFIMFLYFCFRFTEETENTILAICVFIILTFNPYLLDFFSVARGYGLSIAFTMGNLYFFYRWLKERAAFKFAVYSILFASIAVLANFTLLNVFFLILASEFLLLVFSSNETSKIKKLGLLFIFPVALLSFITPVLLHLKAGGSFNVQNFGGDKGLWGDTFETLIYKLFYQHISFAFAEEIFAAIGILLFIICLAIILKNKNDRSGLLLMRFLLLSLVFLICFIYLLHFLTGAQFPRDRTGLFFVPFITLLLVTFLQWLVQASKIGIYLSVLISLLCLVHFTRSANLLYALEYRDDAFIKRSAEFIKKDAGNKKISIGVHYAFFTPFNYYAYLWGETNWIPVEHDALWDQEHDYYFVYPSDITEMKMDSVKEIEKHELTNTLLLKNFRKIRTMEILSELKDDAEGSTNLHFSNLDAGGGKKSFMTDSTTEFSPALSLTLNDTILKASNVIMHFSSQVRTKKFGADAHLVISVQRGDSLFSWQDFDLSYNLPPNEWHRFSFNSILPKSSMKGDLIKAYVWNRGKIEVDVDEMVLSVISYPF